MLGCSTEENIENSGEIQEDVFLKVRKIFFNDAAEGTYKGFLANISGEVRGTYELNITKGGKFALEISIVGQDSRSLNLSKINTDLSKILFQQENTLMQIDLSSVDDPKVTAAIYEGIELTASIHKEDARMPISLKTGVFDSTENPDLTGTWNLILVDPLVLGPPPPPPGSTPIAEVIIIHNGNIYSDDVMELLDETSLCVTSSIETPYISSFDGDDIRLVSNNQTSDFGGGTTDWEVVFYFDAGANNYWDASCNPTASGTFSFTTGGGTTSNGSILIDGFPGL